MDPRREPKSLLEYAINFVELSGEMARSYMHDEHYVPTASVMAELKELKKTMGIYHSALGYIIRTLEERMPGKGPEDTPPDDWYDR